LSYGVVYSNTNASGIKNPDGSFFQPGQPLPPNQLPGASIPPPNEVASPTLKTPRSAQGDLGYSWQANSWLGLNFDLVTIHYTDLPFRFHANFLDPNTGQPLFPQFGDFRMWYGKGWADYNGANIGFHIKVPDTGLTVQGFYTYSKADGITLAGA